MSKKKQATARREGSLSRERIVEASIELLDEAGEGGLTFRALSERLATGPGALYWHVADKADLLVAACDAVVVRALEACTDCATPQATLRALASAVFDAMSEHPWVGSALILSAGKTPTVRLFERIGQQVMAMGVPPVHQWATASALWHYMLGVGGQNAASRVSAQVQGLHRETFLGEVAAAWSALDERAYPFVRSVAPGLALHDDREDFLAGVDLILAGMQSLCERTAGKRRSRESRTGEKDRG